MNDDLTTTEPNTQNLKPFWFNSLMIGISILLLCVIIGLICLVISMNRSNSNIQANKLDSTTTIPFVSQSTSALSIYHDVMSVHFPNSSLVDQDKMGKAVCSLLDSTNGNVDKAIFLIASNLQMRSKASDYGFVIGTSTPAFCPEWTANVKDFSDANH